MDLTSFVILLASVIVTAFLYVRQKYSYWAHHNVPYVEPKFPFGNLDVYGKREHNSQLFARFYRQFKGRAPFCGIYFFLSPAVLAIDVDFIRNVLIKDFQYFQDRGLYYNEKDDPLSAHLFNLEPIRWRALRSKLTPTFTSGKMKYMCPTIVAVANEFQLCLEKIISKDDVVEIRELLGRFTTDIIGTCAFGIDCNSLRNPDAKFREMGRKVFEVQRNGVLARIIMSSSKSLAKKLKMVVHHEDVTAFFLNIVKETVAYREENNVHRNDFMDLLMQLKNTGHLSDDPTKQIGQLTINEIAAEAYVFFLAGFETSSTTLTYCLYEMAMNEDIQNRAREEIEDVLRKHDGQLTYEAINDMVYVERIINEALRKYPPGANVIRSATKDYPVPNSKCVLPINTAVVIPVYAIHHDPDYYPEPQKFLPERFESEEIQKRPSCSYLPFGDGPRNCIGLRFGLLQARIGLITLIKSFVFSTCSKTSIPIKFSPRHLVLSPVDGLWLKVTPVPRP